MRYKLTYEFYDAGMPKDLIVYPGCFVYHGMGGGHYFGTANFIPTPMSAEEATEQAKEDGVEFRYINPY